MKQTILALAVIGLTGCATNPIDVLDSAIFEVKCAGADDKDTCISQSRMEADAAQQRRAARASATGTASGIDCNWHEYSTAGPANVDVAYARARSRHHWRTYNERTRNGNDEWIDDNFIHTASPGSMYNMRDYADFQSPNGDLYVWSRLVLARTKTGTELSASLCLYPKEVKYFSSLKKQLQAIVR